MNGNPLFKQNQDEFLVGPVMKMEPTKMRLLPAYALALLLVVTTLPASEADLVEDATAALDPPTLGMAASSTDTTAPVVTGITSTTHPDSGRYYAEQILRGSIEATDVGGSGIAGYSTYYGPASSTIAPDCTIDRTSSTVWAYHGYGEGAYRVRAIDNASNCGDVAEYRFNVDAIEPTIDDRSPLPGALVAPDVEVQVRYSDKDGGADVDEVRTKVDSSLVRFFIDDVERTASANITENELTYRSPLGFTPGTHTLEIRIHDQSIGTDTVVDSWTFEVDGSTDPDTDGDLVPDASEAALCQRESKGTPADGSCTDGDYHPPNDPAGFLFDGINDTAGTVNALLGATGRAGVYLHFN